MCCWFSTQKLKLVVVLSTLIVAVKKINVLTKIYIIGEMSFNILAPFQIDGEVKASTSGTVLLYHINTKFCHFLISRVVLGCLMTAWASGGFLALFWDSVRALAIVSPMISFLEINSEFFNSKYSSGICLLTIFDCITLAWMFHLSARGLPETDYNEGLIEHMVTTDDIIEIFILVSLIFVQVTHSITSHQKENIFRLVSAGIPTKKQKKKPKQRPPPTQILVSIAGWWLTFRLRQHYEHEMKYEEDHRYLERILASQSKTHVDK